MRNLFLGIIGKKRYRLAMIMIIVVGSILLGYQANMRWAQVASGSSEEIPMVSPTATPTPPAVAGSETASEAEATSSAQATGSGQTGQSGSGAIGTTVSEIDAARRIIPLPGVNLPRGPRKSPPARLVIPSIGLDTKVIELGTYKNERGELVWDTAPFAAGHHFGTANPGEPGNVVISGHISSLREGAVFKRLPEINVGDGVVIFTVDRNYLYQIVEKKTVEPTQIDVMNATKEQMLTIITCFPDGIYSHRLIITAKRV